MHRRWLLGLSLLACTWACALAETVTLQQGTGGYSGCTSSTLWGPKTTRLAKDAAHSLHIRGARNLVLLKFDLPEALARKKLARARLQVFVPKVDRLRMICEIRCREVRQKWTPAATFTEARPGELWTAPGGPRDTTTDYGRGRKPGVLDSYAFWEYDGKYFPHKYRFLTPPEGGTWIDFDVTPIVRKWLGDPDANLGLLLQPVNVPDSRFKNTAEIDIPAETFPDAAKRPRLVLDFEPLEKPYLVGMTHTLRKYCDHDTRFRFPGPFAEHHEMAMARNEFEGFQVLVYPMGGTLEGVSFEWTDLVDPKTGATIPKADIECFRQDVFRLHAKGNGKIGDWYFHGVNFDVPDPLVTASPVDLRPHLSTPFWFNVRTRPATKAGTYKSTVTVKPKNAPPRPLQLTVKVWDYAIPEKWNFETMGQTCWGYIQRAYGKKMTPQMRRKYTDFLLDHRFSPTQQYIDTLSPRLDEIPYCIERGMSTIYLSGNFTGNIGRLKERYEAVKKLGLIHKALVYIGDETKDWKKMRERSDAIRKACPELMIMIGGSFPRPELEGIIDIFDPQIDRRTNRVYSLPADQMLPMVKKTQARGEKFFWYVAAGPMLPCPNVQMEEPLVAARLLFWMTWKFGVTGFEYYCYNIWSHNIPQGGKRWPDAPFTPWGWGNTNGDGMLFYPGPDGPFSSVRFENIRDGIEDWESHYVLRDYVEALALKKGASRATQPDPLLAKAHQLLKVPDELCPMDFVSWSWEPEVLLKAHRELGETIEALTKRVSEAEMLKVRAARKKAELERQQAMLKARAAAAK